jgi:diguanylate cyclase (GGDEF)-like protein/PAS domain S-box-containing protein
MKRSLLRTWSKSSLAVRLMLVSGIMILLTGITYFSTSVHYEIASCQSNLMQDLQHELDFLTPALTEPAIVGDYAAVQQMIATRVRLPAISEISWIDAHGNRITSRTDDEISAAPGWFTRWVDFPRFAQAKEIIVGGENYGRIELVLTSIPATNKIWLELQNKLTALLVSIAILFVVTFAIITHNLRPLHVLSVTARQFGQGRHSMRIKPVGPPEMLACIQAFNNMADNIEQLVHSLHDNGARNRLLAIIVEQSNVPIITKDLNGLITSWNTAAAALYGYTAEEMLGKPSNLLYLPGHETEFENTLSRVKSASSTTLETKRVAQNGSILDVSLSVSPLYDENGTHIGEISVTRDITRQKRAEEAAFDEKERAQVTLASIADAVITTDIHGNVQYINPVAEKLLGLRSEDAYGHALPKVFQAIDEVSGEAIDNPLNTIFNSPDPVNSGMRGEAVLISRNGIRFPIEHSTAPICNRSGSIIGGVLIFRDMSASHNMARQLSWQASHDALTALVNRREFERRLGILVESAHNSEREHALLYMDLDQFKVVNDTRGHVAGDELLRQLSAMLNNRVRGSDTIARLGGDEFGVLLVDCPLNKAMNVAEILRETVAGFRFTWQDKTFVIGVSIGVVPIAGDRQNNSDILGIADAACYAAKDKGRNQVQASPNDRELSQRRGEMLWVSRINSAFEENRFRLYYQPIVPVQPRNDQDSKHYEVLLRMLDHDGHVVPPMTFIPAAERYNLMRSIDRQVISMAFEEYQQRARNGMADNNWMLSINLSGDSLSDVQLFEFLQRQFAKYQVNPQEICFEVTETAAIANLGQAIVLIKDLKGMGCRFSLDDFGSGLSSFGYLKNLPVDYLKIDGSFVRDMAQDPIDAAMVEAINDIGHVMGIQTIAEWVEDDATLERLKQIGVDYAQGYLFDRPRPMQEIMPHLQVVQQDATA